VFHPSHPLPVRMRRQSSAAVSYHVGLDTMMGRRSRHRPEEVAIDGFLLLDTGEYELVTALVPLDVFWKMKALDVVGQVRTANRARVAGPSTYPQIGSVWLVEGALETPETAPSVETAGAHSARGESTQRVFRLRVSVVHALDRVAIEANGPRFVETLHVRDMLPVLGEI